VFVSATTVVVVQSDDLAAWVGSFAGLAGVALGYWLERLGRKHDDQRRLSSDVELASGELFGAMWALQDAVQHANAPDGSAWVQVRADRQATLNALFARIAVAASDELNRAAINIVNVAKAGLPPVAIQDSKAAEQRAAEIGTAAREFLEAMRRAKLKPTRSPPNLHRAVGPGEISTAPQP
jgi:hypothetical protein